jgi:hypothetical protein
MHDSFLPNPSRFITHFHAAIDALQFEILHTGSLLNSGKYSHVLRSGTTAIPQHVRGWKPEIIQIWVPIFQKRNPHNPTALPCMYLIDYEPSHTHTHNPNSTFIQHHKNIQYYDRTVFRFATVLQSNTALGNYNLHSQVELNLRHT